MKHPKTANNIILPHKTTTLLLQTFVWWGVQTCLPPRLCGAIFFNFHIFSTNHFQTLLILRLSFQPCWRSFATWSQKKVEKTMEGSILHCVRDSGIQENIACGIRNTAQGIWNPTKEWNTESKFYWQRLQSSNWNPESMAWNPECKTVLDSLIWGDLFHPHTQELK